MASPTEGPPARAGTNEAVQRYWDTQPCGTRESAAVVGSREFFAELEAARYRWEWFIPPLVDFPRWRGQRVLEVGCGLGTDTLQFLRAGARVTALDLSSRSVALARQRALGEGQGGVFLNADAERLPFADSSFDLVYSWGVLHHTADTARAVREVRRVLRPGGTALVMLYHRRSLFAALVWLRYGLLRGRGFKSVSELLAAHLESLGTKAYTRAEARQLFEGYARVTVKPLLTPYDTRRPLYRLLRHLLPDAIGWFLLIEAVK